MAIRIERVQMQRHYDMLLDASQRWANARWMCRSVDNAKAAASFCTCVRCRQSFGLTSNDRAQQPLQDSASPAITASLTGLARLG
jgi:hypothetical protein